VVAIFKSAEVTMNITPEIRHAIEQSGPEVLRLDDPLSTETNVLLTATAFEKIQRLVAPIVSERDDWQSADAYAATDEAFDEGREAPGMSGYDESVASTDSTVHVQRIGSNR
jgi:hypothetical protein